MSSTDHQFVLTPEFFIGTVMVHERIARIETNIDHIWREIGSIKVELQDIRSELKDIRSEIKDLRTELKSDIRWIFGIVGISASSVVGGFWYIITHSVIQIIK
jgi:phage-related protein